MSTSTLPSTLASNGTIGTSAIPACAHCGGLSYRLDAVRRGCFNCAEQTAISFHGNTWATSQLVRYRDGTGATRLLRVTAIGA